MPAQITEAESVEDLLEAYLPRRSGGGHAVYLTLLALLLAGIAVLPLIRIDLTVAAPGIIRPVAEKHEVRARYSGAAERVFGRRGERVAAGQALITLRSDAVDQRRTVIAQRLAELADQARDLGLLLEGSLAPETGDVLRSPRFRAEHDKLLGELADLAVRSERARVELARAEALVERSLIPARELEERTFEVRQLEASRELLLARYATEWRRTLEEVRRETAELRVESRRLEEERRSLVAVSPVTGTIEEMTSVAAGSFVQAGEVIAVISPDTSLVAEVYIHPADVGLLRRGMPVRLHVDAFSYHDWGPLPGKLLGISNDFLVVGEQPAFRGVVELAREQLSLPNGAQGVVRKGMTLQARFRLADRSLLQLLRDDVNDWLHPWDFAPEPGNAAQAGMPTG